MSIYVGKDVNIKIQVPVEREPHIIPSNPGPYTVTVDSIPISDRDQDGVPNEVAHVTVKDASGNTITPASVVDATGVVTFNSGDAGKKIFVTYRYDSEPYFAQEITIEPRQVIEGVDGLGSDLIQEWAVLQKEFGGSIKEVFRTGDPEQLARVAARTELSDPFVNTDNWQALAGTWQLMYGAYDGYSEAGYGESLLKNPLTLKNLDAEFQIQHKSGGLYDVALIFRRVDGQNFYYFGLNQSTDRVFLKKCVGGSYSEVAGIGVTINPDTWYKLRIVVKDTKFECFKDDELLFEASDSSLQSPGRIGFYINNVYTEAMFDDLTIKSPPLRGIEHGLIVSWVQGGSAVKIGLDKVVFPEGSIPSPKNAPVFITTPFKAQAAKTIS